MAIKPSVYDLEKQPWMLTGYHYPEKIAKDAGLFSLPCQQDVVTFRSRQPFSVGLLFTGYQLDSPGCYDLYGQYGMAYSNQSSPHPPPPFLCHLSA